MKLTRKMKKRIDGAISLFMVVILLPTMLLSGLMVDMARFSMAKSLISSAGDLTMNAALADYDGILQDVYGLFAVSQNDEDLYNNLSDYFEKTLVSNNVVEEDESEDYVKGLLGTLEQYLYLGESGEAHVTNLFDMEVKTENPVSGVEQSTLDHSQVLKKQIVEYMKYRAPINLALSFFSGFGTFSQAESQSTVVEKKVQAETYTDTVTKNAKSLYDFIQVYDNELFKTKKYGDSFTEPSRACTEANENDTVELKHVLNRENSGEGAMEEGIMLVDATEYNYKQISRYVLGFAFDDEQGDITNGGSAINVENSEYNTSIKSDADDETAVTTLSNEYNLYIQQIQTMMNDSRYQPLFDQVTSFMTNNGIVEMHGDDEKNAKRTAITTEVRSNLTTALPNYKTLMGFIKAANEENSDAKALIDSYKTLMGKKIIAEKAFSAVQKMLDDVTKDISDTEELIEEKEGEIEAIDLALNGDEKTEGLYTKKLKAKTQEEKDKIQNDEINPKETQKRSLEIDLDGYVNEDGEKITEGLRTKLSGLKNRQTYLQNGLNAVRGDEHSLSYYIDPTETIPGHYSVSTMQENASKTVAKLDDIYLCYKWYREAGWNYGDLLVKGVYDEAQYLYNKIDKLTKAANNVSLAVTTLKTSVEEYNRRLGEWEDANTKYSKNKGPAGNTEDEFAESNSKEISAAKTAYNLEQIEELKTYIVKQYNNILPLSNYISNPASNGYKYGTQFFWNVSDLNGAKQAVQNIGNTSATFTNNTTVTLADIDNYFGTVCSNYHYNETSSKMLSFMRDDRVNAEGSVEPLLPFVGYLKATFPESAAVSMEKTTVETSSEGETKEEDAKKLYDTMKDDLKKDKSLEAEDVKSKYGYTYAEEGKVTPATKDNSEEIKSKVDSDKASDEFTSKKNASSGFFANLKKYLTSGRDNLFVMEYIFGNFSYNTMVQDAAFEYYTKGIEKDDHKIEGASKLEKQDFYANTLAGTINYEPFMALKLADSDKVEDSWVKARRPQTLSGYAISEYNNEFYGAEVEYLLYGMKTPKNNVTTADAAIFAIRFLMNCVYAFSNSKIRNTTRTAGLAVQAASCGIIPYQLVMVVLQLALSVSESLLDLQVMHTGAKVALMPTTKTWFLSPSNAGQLLKDVAAAKTKQVVEEATKVAIDYVSTGIQDFIDCSAEEIGDKSEDLIKGLQYATKAKANELMDKSFSYVEETVMEQLNKLKSLDPTTTADAVVSDAFTKAREAADSTLNSLDTAGGEIGPLIKDTLKNKINEILNEAETEAQAKLSNLQATYGVENVTTYATTLCNDVQRSFSEKMTKRIDDCAKEVGDKTSGLITETAKKIKDCVAENAEDAKEKIVKEANKFIDDKVNTITDKMPDSTKLAGLDGEDRAHIVSGDGAASNAISFGYSDYLRVFLFLGLCTQDEQIYSRLANLIESNINYPNIRADKEIAEAGEGAKDKSWYEEIFNKISWLFKKKSSDKTEETPEDDKWHVNKAYTYVKVDAEIEMKMFFLDTELFSAMINAAYSEAGEELPDASKTKATYHYISVMGY